MNYAEMLVDWFLKNKREMPWRNTSDPYWIWVSEIMLQQTQVSTVIPYYEKFMGRFNTVQALAEADIEEVYHYWQGLGYYRRANNLHKGAQLVATTFEGEFPTDAKIARKIPGIGDYTVGAILSIAFHQKLPAVDGNVMRILSRQFLIEEDIAVPKNRRIFEDKVMELMNAHPNPFNQGLMELGALICTPKNPKCESCPVRSLCKAYAENRIEEFPVKSKKAKVEKERYKALVIKKGDSYWLEKREDGLLANLWGLPLVKEEEWESGGLKTSLSEAIVRTDYKTVTHVFTHKKWEMEPILLEEEGVKNINKVIGTNANGSFVTTEEMKSLPISTAFKKVIKEAIE